MVIFPFMTINDWTLTIVSIAIIGINENVFKVKMTSENGFLKEGSSEKLWSNEKKSPIFRQFSFEKWTKTGNGWPLHNIALKVTILRYRHSPMHIILLI